MSETRKTTVNTKVKVIAKNAPQNQKDAIAKKEAQKATRRAIFMDMYDKQNRLHIGTWTLNVSRIDDVLIIKGFDNNAIYTVTNVDNSPFIESWSKFSLKTREDKRDFNSMLVENNAPICKQALLSCFSGLSFADVLACSKVKELTENKSNGYIFVLADIARNHADVKNEEIAHKKAKAKQTV